MKQFDEWWEAYRYDPASIDEAFEEAFKAGRRIGMLAAADLADQWFYPVVDNETCVKAGRRLAEAIREAADNGND